MLVGLLLPFGCNTPVAEPDNEGGGSEVQPPTDPPQENPSPECRALLAAADAVAVATPNIQGFVGVSIVGPIAGITVGGQIFWIPADAVRNLSQEAGFVTVCNRTFALEERVEDLEDENDAQQEDIEDIQEDIGDLQAENDQQQEQIDDLLDGCPNDLNKTAPGVCGCGHPDTDSDGDGDPNCVDNCPAVANADQADGDGDGKGNLCDNCPTISNSDQADADGDGTGNLCEPTPPSPPSSNHCDDLGISDEESLVHIDVYDVDVSAGDSVTRLIAEDRLIGVLYIIVSNGQPSGTRCRFTGDREASIEGFNVCPLDSPVHLDGFDAATEASTDWTSGTFRIAYRTTNGELRTVVFSCSSF